MIMIMIGNWDAKLSVVCNRRVSNLLKPVINAECVVGTPYDNQYPMYIRTTMTFFRSTHQLLLDF